MSVIKSINLQPNSNYIQHFSQSFSETKNDSYEFSTKNEEDFEKILRGFKCPLYNEPTEFEKVSFKSFIGNLDFVSEFEFLYELLPPAMSDGPWICGGSLMKTYMNSQLGDSDIDIYFKNQLQFDEYEKKLLSVIPTTTVIKKSKLSNNKTFMFDFKGKKFKIQLICIFFFDSLKLVIDSFDFDICRIGYDGTDVIYDKTTLDSINRREIIIKKITHPKTQICRLMKYSKIGFSCSSNEVEKILLAERLSLNSEKNQKDINFT